MFLSQFKVLMFNFFGTLVVRHFAYIYRNVRIGLGDWYLQLSAGPTHCLLYTVRGLHKASFQENIVGAAQLHTHDCVPMHQCLDRTTPKQKDTNAKGKYTKLRES